MIINKSIDSFCNVINILIIKVHIMLKIIIFFDNEARLH